MNCQRLGYFKSQIQLQLKIQESISLLSISLTFQHCSFQNELFARGEGGEGALVFEVGYCPRNKIHIIRVVFQDQAMYARTSFRGAKMCKIGKKRVCFWPGEVLRFELDRGVLLGPQNPYPSLRVILAKKGNFPSKTGIFFKKSAIFRVFAWWKPQKSSCNLGLGQGSWPTFKDFL